MKNKLIITESQLVRLKKVLSEEYGHAGLVKKLKEFLDANYTPTETYVREGGEYRNMPMVKVNVDEEIISPKALYEYMKYKFEMGDDFTKQVIKDWIFGRISDDYQLTKNVPLS
jgi:hypothetical protein